MLKKYLVIIIGFVLITAPGAIDAWLSLVDRFRGGAAMTINLGSWRDIYNVAFPILGLAVLVWGLWWTRPTKDKPVVKSEDETKQAAQSLDNRPDIRWLHMVVNQDLQSLRSGVGERRIQCLQKTPDYRGIIKSEPFMQLDLRVLNIAVFPLLVEGVKGKMTIEDEPCQREVEWIRDKGNETLEMQHAEWQWIHIKQVFTTKERAEEIRSRGRQTQHLRINLNECALMVRPQIPGRETKPVAVSLGNNIELIEWVEPTK